VSNVPKWQVVENVVAALERAQGKASGWHVYQNARVMQRNSSKRRQVDVCVICPSKPREFRVAIDVKDERRPLDIELVEQLCVKGSKLAVDRYVIVSTSGYSAEAFAEAQKNGVVALTLTEGDLSGVFRAFQFHILRPEIVSVGLEYGPNELKPDVMGPEGWLVGTRECVHLKEFARRAVHLIQDEQDVPIGIGTFKTLALNCRRPWTGIRLNENLCPPPDWLLITCKYHENIIVDAECRLGIAGIEQHPSEVQTNDTYLVTEEGHWRFVDFLSVVLEEAQSRLNRIESPEIVRVLVYNWCSIRIEGVEWTAPSAMEIEWRIVSESPNARKFRTESGQELVTALVSLAVGSNQQMTLLSTEAAEGGNNLSISFGPARPERIDV
jgi:hypothetical protein